MLETLNSPRRTNQMVTDNSGQPIKKQGRNPEKQSHDRQPIACELFTCGPINEYIW